MTAIPAPPTPVVNVTTTAPAPTAISMRLPQCQIKHFRGDVPEWTQFWESFYAAVHSSTLSNVKKIDYLKVYLSIILNSQMLTTRSPLTSWKICIAKRISKSTPFWKTGHFSASNGRKWRHSTKELSAETPIPDQRVRSFISPDKLVWRLFAARLIKLIPSGLQLEWEKSTTNKTTDIEGVI